jgi:hypothetical protein
MASRIPKQDDVALAMGRQQLKSAAVKIKPIRLAGEPPFIRSRVIHTSSLAQSAAYFYPKIF